MDAKNSPYARLGYNENSLSMSETELSSAGMGSMLSLFLAWLYTTPFFLLSYYSSLAWHKFPRGIAAIGESRKIIGCL